MGSLMPENSSDYPGTCEIYLEQNAENQCVLCFKNRDNLLISEWSYIIYIYIYFIIN